MGNGKVDPWALLREVRETLENGEYYTKAYHEQIDRINTALATHKAEERDEVRWMSNGFVAEEQIADVKGGTLIVQDRGPDDWAWMLIRRGREMTEDKAKSAAIAAARSK